MCSDATLQAEYVSAFVKVILLPTPSLYDFVSAP